MNTTRNLGVREVPMAAIVKRTCDMEPRTSVLRAPGELSGRREHDLAEVLRAIQPPDGVRD
jgi:hypothetical protein